MLGRALQGEMEELATLIQSVGADQYRRVLGMCLATAAYITVDVRTHMHEAFSAQNT